jgi:hypothetical protein
MRRRRSNGTTRRWLFAWLGGSVLGIANGGFREAILKRRVGESTAQRISTGSLAALLCLYFAALQRRWPLATRRDALEIGATWAALTVAFEFLFGHYVDKQSWEELAAAYDLREEKLWPAILAWIALGPAVTRELAPA